MALFSDLAKIPKDRLITVVILITALAIAFVLIVWYLFGYQFNIATVSSGTIEAAT